MAEIRKGFSWGSLTTFIGLVAIVTYLVWASTSKENNQNYDQGSTHSEMTISPTHNPMSFGCDRYILKDTPQGIKYVPLSTNK